MAGAVDVRTSTPPTAKRALETTNHSQEQIPKKGKENKMKQKLMKIWTMFTDLLESIVMFIFGLFVIWLAAWAFYGALIVALTIIIVSFVAMEGTNMLHKIASKFKRQMVF